MAMIVVVSSSLAVMMGFTRFNHIKLTPTNNSVARTAVHAAFVSRQSSLVTAPVVTLKPRLHDEACSTS